MAGPLVMALQAALASTLKSGEGLDACSCHFMIKRHCLVNHAGNNDTLLLLCQSLSHNHTHLSIYQHVNDSSTSKILKNNMDLKP